MASPPYNHSYSMSGVSPPYPSHTQLPQPPKRRQSDMPSSAPSIKRRKASMLSTTSASSHPLRQTSFPPENNYMRGTRSPSADTMSIASASVTGAKKKKTKKMRGAKGGDRDDLASVNGRKAKSTVSGDGEGGNKRKRGQTVEEDEDEEQGGEDMALNVDATSKEEKIREERRRQILVRQFEKVEGQFQRYEAWRSSKLSDAVVRRIVNQTLSQSVPPNVILAIKSAAKIFAGEMIEKARKVQTQWLDAEGKLIPKLPSPPAEGSDVEVVVEKEKRRGPLEPEHLREAHRRHLMEADGGLVGRLGLWQVQAHTGVERFAVKVQGKRLFK